MVEKAINSIRKKIRWVLLMKSLVKEEMEVSVKIGLYNRISAWRHGFWSRSFMLYSLDTNDRADYLSDYAKVLKTPYINGEYSIVLNNKLIFWEVMQKFVDYLPEHYGFIQKGNIYNLNHQFKNNNINDLYELGKKNNGLVLKPIGRGGGTGIIILKSESGGIVMNGKEAKLSDIDRLIRNLDNYLIVECVMQAQYSSTIYPRTTNTIRVLTMWDYETNKPFIASVAHRFGTERSFPVDNSQKGGLRVGISLDTGEMGCGTTRPYTGRFIWYENHPDSRQRIKGVFVPNWAAIKEGIIKMANALPYIPYIGWDIVVEEEGFKIIEGNNHPGIDILQAQHPLLKDPRIRRFYKAHGVI
jgi:hypothetical protein